MTATLNAAVEPPVAPGASPAHRSAANAFYWSVRRELWEHRAIYLAPLTVAALVLFGFAIATLHLSSHVQFSATGPILSPTAPYDFAAITVIATMLIIAIFYSLGALHGERRDRSILFWKSLPVSDLTTVLSKASIPLVVLPATAFAVILATQAIMLVIGAAALVASGQGAGPLLAHVASPQGWLFLLYSLIVLSLWYAPIYGWLLLVSGWAKRAPFLWAILPPLALCLVEKIGFNSAHVGALLGERIGGFTQAFVDGAFTPHGVDSGSRGPLALIDPVRFVTSPGLWGGLVFAAACLAAAVWLRRRREPI